MFRHYLITCLNVGLYSHPADGPGNRMPVEQWMQHRMKLFTTFTLPSVVGQTCQNFTWFLCIDEKTPLEYIDILPRPGIPNLRILPLSCKALCNEPIAAEIMRHIEPGNYDLITTELDSDDAIHRDLIRTIQASYQSSGKSTLISFVHGLILDLKGCCLYPMGYAFHCPTFVEQRSMAQSVYRWPNSEIPAEKIELIPEHPYWLQVIHSLNVVNNLESQPQRTIGLDHPLPLSLLAGFHLDLNRVMNLDA